LVENRDFFITLAFDAPVRGLRRNNATKFGMKKLEWCAYLKVKKFYDMFSRFDRIPACDRQTGRRQTDKRTDGQTSCDLIVRAMHTRREI